MYPISGTMLPATNAGNLKTLSIGDAFDSGLNSILFYVVEITEYNFVAEGSLPLCSDENVLVKIFGSKPKPAQVGWISDNRYFFEFSTPIPAEEIAALKDFAGQKPSLPPAKSVPSQSLGASLRRVRESRGVSQKTLAAKMGVSVPTISMWESDHRRPSIERLAKICEILNASAEDFLAGVGTNELSELLTQMREQVSKFLGMTPDKVRIFIEL